MVLFFDSERPIKGLRIPIIYCADGFSNSWMYNLLGRNELAEIGSNYASTSDRHLKLLAEETGYSNRPRGMTSALTNHHQNEVVFVQMP